MNMEAILDGQHQLDRENLRMIITFLDKIDGVILNPRENDREIQRTVKPTYDGNFIAGFFVMDYEQEGETVTVLHTGYYNPDGGFVGRGPALFSSAYLKAYQRPPEKRLRPEELYSFEEL